MQSTCALQCPKHSPICCWFGPCLPALILCSGAEEGEGGPVCCCMSLSRAWWCCDNADRFLHDAHVKLDIVPGFILNAGSFPQFSKAQPHPISLNRQIHQLYVFPFICFIHSLSNNKSNSPCEAMEAGLWQCAGVVLQPLAG